MASLAEAVPYVSQPLRGTGLLRPPDLSGYHVGEKGITVRENPSMPGTLSISVASLDGPAKHRL